MIEQSLLQQVKQVFAALESQYTLRLEADSTHESYEEFKQFLTEFASTSDHLTLEVVETPGTLRMVLAKDGKDTGIVFRCIPGGHEFTSLLLAVYNADGKGKTLPDEAIAALEQYQPRQKDGPAIPLPNDLENYMQGLERNLLIKALEDCNYNKTKAAEKLGISFRAMRYKLKKLGID